MTVARRTVARRTVAGLLLIAAAVGLVVLWWTSSTDSTSPELSSPGSVSPDSVSLEEATPVLPPEVEARLAGVVANMWWHQEEMGGVLGLGEEQIRRMDEICLDFLRRRRLRREERLEDRGAFDEALARVDLAAAERAVEEREQRAAADVGAADRMVLAVLGVLTPEQLRRAEAELPRLFRQSWLRSVSGSRTGRPGRLRGPGAGRDGGGESAESPTASGEGPARD